MRKKDPRPAEDNPRAWDPLCANDRTREVPLGASIGKKNLAGSKLGSSGLEAPAAATTSPVAATTTAAAARRLLAGLVHCEGPTAEFLAV